MGTKEHSEWGIKPIRSKALAKLLSSDVTKH